MGLCWGDKKRGRILQARNQGRKAKQRNRWCHHQRYNRRTIFRSRKFCCCRLPGDLYIFVCVRFLSLLRKLRFWIPRQESTALWSLRMCVKILRVVVVGRKKMMVLCIGNTKELLLLRSSSSAALLAHAFLLPQFL